MLINSILRQVINERNIVIDNKINNNIEIRKFNLNSIFIVNCISKIHYLIKDNEVEVKNKENHFTEIILNESQIHKVFKLKKTNFKAEKIFNRTNSTEITFIEDKKVIRLKPIEILNTKKSHIKGKGIKQYKEIKVLVPSIFFDCFVKQKIEVYQKIKNEQQNDIKKEESKEKILKLKDRIKETEKSILWRKNLDYYYSLEFYRNFLRLNDFYRLIFEYYLNEKKNVILAKRETNLTYKIFYNYFYEVIIHSSFNVSIFKEEIFNYILDSTFYYQKPTNKKLFRCMNGHNRYQKIEIFLEEINKKIEIVNKILFTNYTDIEKLKRVYQNGYFIYFESFKKNDRE